MLMRTWSRIMRIVIEKVKKVVEVKIKIKIEMMIINYLSSFYLSRYRGNNGNGKGGFDSLNNNEQVFIGSPTLQKYQVSYDMLRYDTICHIMLCYIMFYHFMLCYVISCYVISCYVTLCSIILCYVMSYHVIL